MSFPRYPAYKDSGVEWLGEVPTHWDIARLKFVAHVQTGVAKGKDNTAKSTIQVPYLRVANVQDGYIDLDDVALIEIPETDLPRYQLQAGDVLMNEGGDFDKLGRGHIWDGSISPCIHQNHVFAVRPHGVSPEWLNTVTGSKYAQFYFMSRSKQSTNLASISSTNVMELPVVMPPQPERQAIVSFLTRETAKIDALVAEQEKLIALLKEKRQAVISHAVTKGLGPSVPMKDSGVEWLGEVPAHWETTRLKYATDFIVDCPHETPVYAEEGDYLVIRTADIEEGNLTKSEMYRVDQSEYLNRIRRQSLMSLDIVYGREGERWGHAALVPENDKFCLGQRMMQFRASYSFLAEFMMWQLNSDAIYRQGQIDTVGATAPHVNVGTIRNYALTQPPIDEQHQISTYLNQQSIDFDSLISEAQSAITLLQERRTALISAAVTGQIKVTAD